MFANFHKHKYLVFSFIFHLLLLLLLCLLCSSVATSKEELQISTVEIVFNKETIPTAFGKEDHKKPQVNSKSKSEEIEEDTNTQIEDMDFDMRTTSPKPQKEESFQIEKESLIASSTTFTQKLPLMTKKFSSAHLRDILTKRGARKKRAKSLASSAKVSAQGGNGNLKIPSLFGAKVTGGNIILAMDVSPSMNLPRAKEQLKKVCQSLLKEQKFNLIAFADKPKAWKKKLVLAKEKNKKSAIRWINRLKTKEGTNIYRVVKKAFSMVNKTKEKHVLYLITDGYSTRTKNYPIGLLQIISQWNRREQMIIHTIGVGYQNHYFLRNLARENLGEYFPQ